MNIKWSNMSGFGPSAWNQSNSLSAIRVTLPGTGRKSGAAGNNSGSKQASADGSDDPAVEQTAA